MTAGPLSPEPRAQGWAHRRHSVNIWWKKMNKLMPPMCILPVITKIVIVHFDLSKNGHFGKAVSPKPCFSGLYPASLTGPPPAHVGAIRPMQGEGAKAAPSPTAGQLCGGTVELLALSCPAQSWRSGSPCGPAPGAPSSRSPGLCSPVLPDSQASWEAERVSPWLGPCGSQPLSAHCALTVSRELCVTNACTPSPTEMTRDLLSHTQASAPPSCPGPAAPGAHL